MEQIIMTGTNASGLIEALPGLGVQIKSIEIDVPLNEVGTTDPVVSFSGSVQGLYSFHSDTTLELRFDKGEDVYITTADFTAEYSAIVRYVRYGEQDCYMAINNPQFKIPTPWRFR